MTDTDAIALARQIATHPWFIWLPAMLDITDRSRCVREDHGLGPLWYCPGDSHVWPDKTYPSLPDPRDSATRARMLDIIKFQCGSERVSVRWCGSTQEWRCELDEPNGWAVCRKTEIDAVAAAFLSMPR